LKITRITEDSDKTIVFQNTDTNFYNINRSVAQDLNLDSLKRKVLNKTVTLHLTKVIVGITSEHISQLALSDDIIYKEY